MTILTIILYYYELSIRNNNKKYDYISRLFAIINFIARPTSIIPLTFLWPYRLFTMSGKFADRVKFFFLNVFTVLLMIATSILVDSLYYKKFTWSAWNFFQFNYVEKGSNLYGNEEIYWYFAYAIPKLISGYIPLFVFGLYQYIKDQHAKKSHYYLIFILFYFIGFLTLNGHKEDRFLMPIFPIFMMITLYGFLNSKLPKTFIWTLAILGLICNLYIFIFEGF